MPEGKIIPVILSGGSGTRLWPLSREVYPKQFIKLLGDHSLFQQTCRRVDHPMFGKPVILCNEDHRFVVAEQLRTIGMEAAAIILEPVRRNTAPSMLIAALWAAQQGPEAMVFALPSDHAISDTEALMQSLLVGTSAAREGNIVTFGIRPDSPHTGYGYIETVPGERILDVRRFTEKPKKQEAEQYLQTGNYFWNSGMFLFSAQTMIDTFARHAPDMIEPCEQALDRASSDLDFLRLDKEAYARCDEISVDYAIMEKADNICCVPLQTQWSDLGTWMAVAECFARDEHGNAAHGEAMFVDSRDCFAYSADGAHLVINGLEKVIVVSTRDAILITSRDATQNIGHIVKRRRALGYPDVRYHTREYRPWGHFDKLIESKRFQVKCLYINPGEKLSLQSHQFRSEHWVVVEGVVKVTIGDEERTLKVDESVFIPARVKHRLENPGKTPALLIEVQTGDYLGEDDIIRYDDIYKRDL